MQESVEAIFSNTFFVFSWQGLLMQLLHGSYSLIELYMAFLLWYHESEWHYISKTKLTCKLLLNMSHRKLQKRLWVLQVEDTQPVNSSLLSFDLLDLLVLSEYPNESLTIPWCFFTFLQSIPNHILKTLLPPPACCQVCQFSVFYVLFEKCRKHEPYNWQRRLLIFLCVNDETWY